jgi:phthiocerol/phenolphthiocerol synthesis type-I polyketide synthase E
MTEEVEEVAIIGMSGAFPGARDIASMWRLLLEKGEGVSTLGRDEILASGEPPSIADDPTYVPRGGFLDDAELFDAEAFGMSPAEAEATDPQQRLFLRHSRLALEDAGYPPGNVAVPVGVFAGESAPQYWFLQNGGLVTRDLDGFRLLMGNDKDFLATRVSYKLDLRGPSIDVQTACSTSLVAVGMACQSLLTWSCDMALAGGVTVTAPRKRGYIASEGMISSPSGVCRPFDAAADGTLFSEGVGVVCLKRLSDALRDRDYIYAVIKSVAINNDGSDKAGYTAPSVNGQAAVIELAHELAGIDARDIGYVEAHGTGTPIGDPIEVGALSAAFRKKTDSIGYCRLGSIKANLGHMDAAAGIAGLIKSALIVNTGLVPPMRNFSAPNPLLELVDTPFRINSWTERWDAASGPRLAGVSSFGIGGTNAHAIVSSPPRSPEAASSPVDGVPLLLASDDPETLAEYRASVAEYLEREPEAAVGDIAAKVARSGLGHPYRWSAVASDRESLLGALREEPVIPEPARRRRLVLAFPGQGAQYAGMARGYYGKLREFSSWVDRGIEIVSPLGVPEARSLLLEGGRDADSAETEVAQPLLFIVEYALAKELERAGLRPDALLGHSIGEYAAAAISGVMDFEAALALVRRRGYWMQRAPRGGMTAVAASRSEIEPLLGEGVQISVCNAERQVVAAGGLEALGAFEERIAGAGLKFTRLKTSHAFHSPMMDGILDSFARDVASTSFSSPRVPILSNLDGRWIEADVDWRRYWVQQLRNPVRFDLCIKALEGSPDPYVVETGPGRAIAGFVRASGARGIDGHALMPGERADERYFTKSLALFWERGLEVAWPRPMASASRLVLLPGRPFRARRSWREVPVGERAVAHRVAQAQDAAATEVPASGRGDGRGDIRAAIRGVWREVLGASPATDDTSFFLSGGDSFAGVQMVGALKRYLGMDLRIQDLLACPSVSALASLSDRGPEAVADRSPDELLFPIQRRGDRPPLFLVAGAHENRYFDVDSGKNSYEEDFFSYFSSIIASLREDQPLYGFRAKGVLKGERFYSSVEAMAARNIAAMKRIQPSGPYYIGGECVGGIVAHEMACQLEAMGEKVGALILLDTPKPSLWIAAREEFNCMVNWLRATKVSLKESILSGGAMGLARWMMDCLPRISIFCFPASEEMRDKRRAMTGSRVYQRKLLLHSPKAYAGRAALLINHSWNWKYRFMMGWTQEAGRKISLYVIPGEHRFRLVKNGSLVGSIIEEIISGR